MLLAAPTFAFEGHITATLTRNGEKLSFLYTVSANQLRVEPLETNRPYPKSIIELNSGDQLVLYPHNRSFVRLKAASISARPDASPLPLPPGDLPAGIGPQRSNLPPFQSAPPMPPIPMPAAEPAALKPSGQTTNLLGYACARYALKQAGEMMDIWATEKLPAFQPWLPNQRRAGYGPRRLEDQWLDLMNAQKLFPLLAVLKTEHGLERLRFEVNSIKPEKLNDAERKLFQPPPEYHEVQPPPF